MNDALLLEKRGTTAILTLNNPPANTWTTESLNQLRGLVSELNEDKNNYCLIITSNSEKFFSAGADLNGFNHDDKGRARDFIGAFGAAFEALSNYTGVSIAAITGFAMGGGLEVALCCDIRIAEEQAQMALPECTVGLLPGGLGTQQLPWLIGEAWAKRMILLGERVKADKAEQIGLVQELVPTGESLAVALKMAERVAGQSPVSVRICKELIMKARSQPLTSAYAQERERFVDLFDYKDRAEGVKAFIEKRKPEWSNS